MRRQVSNSHYTMEQNDVNMEEKEGCVVGESIGNNDNDKAMEESDEKDSDVKDKKPTTRGGGSRQQRHSCVSCTRTFSSKRDLVTHQYMHRENPVFLCATCNKSFTTESAFRRHSQSHCRKLVNTTPRRQYMCSQCGVVFETMKQLSTHHSAKHVDEKRFVCGICGSQFAWPENLRAHHRTHEVNPHECPVCGRRFVDATSLRVHTRNSHGPDSEPSTPRKTFTCSLCGRAYQFDFSLRAHMKGHAQSPATAHHFQTMTSDVAIRLEKNGQSASNVARSHVQVDQDGIIDINAVDGADGHASEIIVEVYNFSGSDVADAIEEKTDNSSNIPGLMAPENNHSAKKLALLEFDERNDKAETLTPNKELSENVLHLSMEMDSKGDNADDPLKADGSNDVVSSGDVESHRVNNDDNTEHGKFVWYAPPQEAVNDEAAVRHNLQPYHLASIIENTVDVSRPSIEPAVIEVRVVEKVGVIPGCEVLSTKLTVDKVSNVPDSKVLQTELASTVELPVHQSPQLESDKPFINIPQSKPSAHVLSHSAEEEEMLESEDDLEVHETDELLANLSRQKAVSQHHGVNEQLKTAQPTLNFMNDDTKPRRAAPFIMHRSTIGTHKRAPRKREPFMFNCIMTDEKPFSCSVCGESFRWEISLNIHLRLHTDGTFPNQTRKALGGRLLAHRGSVRGACLRGASAKSVVGHSRIVPRCASSDEEEVNDGDAYCFLIKPEEETDPPSTSTLGAKSYRRFLMASDVNAHGKTEHGRIWGTRLLKRDGRSDVKSVAGNCCGANGASEPVVQPVCESQLIYVTVESADSQTCQVQSDALKTSEGKLVDAKSSEITIGQEVICLDDLIASNSDDNYIRQSSQSVDTPAPVIPAIMIIESSMDTKSAAPVFQIISNYNTTAKSADIQMWWCKHQEACRRAGFICRMCESVVTSLAAVRRHRRRHALTDGHLHTLPCASCPACFTSRSDLLLHRRVCHSNCHHPCRACHRVFTSTIRLRCHQRIHKLVVQPSVCRHCGKRYFLDDKRVVHETRHSCG